MTFANGADRCILVEEVLSRRVVRALSLVLVVAVVFPSLGSGAIAQSISRPLTSSTPLLPPPPPLPVPLGSHPSLPPQARLPLIRPTSPPLIRPKFGISAQKIRHGAGLRAAGVPPLPKFAGDYRRLHVTLSELTSNPLLSPHPLSSASSSPTTSRSSRSAIGKSVLGTRRTSSVDVTQPNVTGLTSWWTYSEGSLPGVGRYMVNVATQNLLIQSDDMDIPHHGVDIAFRRTFNSLSGHNYAGSDGSVLIGQYGSGWTNTWDAHLSTNSSIGNPSFGMFGSGMSVYDGASAATSNCTGRGHLKMYRPERSDYCRNLATLASSPSDFVP